MSGTPVSESSVVDRRPTPPIEPGALLREAWSRFASAWPRCLLVYWGAFAAYWLIMNLAVIVLAAMNAAVDDPSFTPVLEFVRFVGMFLIPVWLWLGQGILFLRIARQEPFEPDDLFRGHPYVLTTVLVLSSLLFVTVVPWLAIYGATEGILRAVDQPTLAEMAHKITMARNEGDFAEIDRIAPVFLSAMTPAFFVGTAVLLAVRSRFRSSTFLILDRNSGVVESLAASFRLTSGRARSLFVLQMAQFAINLAGFLPLGLGLLVTLPFTRLVSAIAYEALAADLPPVEDVEEDTDPE